MRPATIWESNWRTYRERGSLHMIALLKSHLEGDDKDVLSVAMQAAAHEARLGHIAIAKQSCATLLTKSRSGVRRRFAATPAQLVVARAAWRTGESALRPDALDPLRRHGVARGSGRAAEARAPRTAAAEAVARTQPEPTWRKLLFLGPPGSGKTMTASALAGELHLPLFTIMLEGLMRSSWARRRRNCASSSKPSARPRAFISSTNSMRWARTEARRTTWAKSARPEFVPAVAGKRQLAEPSSSRPQTTPRCSTERFFVGSTT